MLTTVAPVSVQRVQIRYKVYNVRNFNKRDVCRLFQNFEFDSVKLSETEKEDRNKYIL